jgi:hypothetical protein
VRVCCPIVYLGFKGTSFRLHSFIVDVWVSKYFLVISDASSTMERAVFIPVSVYPPSLHVNPSTRACRQEAIFRADLSGERVGFMSLDQWHTDRIPRVKERGTKSLKIDIQFDAFASYTRE